MTAKTATEKNNFVSSTDLNTSQNAAIFKTPELDPNNPASADEIVNELKLVYRGKGKRQPQSLSEINNEHAVIMVIGDNKKFKATNAEDAIKTAKLRFISDKFYLQSFQENRNEKVQILETFGEPYVSFFGERAKIYQGAGILLEADTIGATGLASYKYRWASSFNKFYEEQLRGTKLIENGNIAVLLVGSYVLYGYFLNLIINTSAGVPNQKSFSFSFLVREHRSVLEDNLDILYDIYAQILKASDINQWKALSALLNTYMEQLSKLESELSTTENSIRINSINSQISYYKSLRDDVLNNMSSIIGNAINKEFED